VTQHRPHVCSSPVRVEGDAADLTQMDRLCYVHPNTIEQCCVIINGLRAAMAALEDNKGQKYRKSSNNKI
jgi:hypothetical protein